MTLSSAETSRYHRHLLLREVGSAGQLKLKSSSVLIIGAGGLGSPAALYLAAAGVGTLWIADGDRVEVSNLHRQVLFDTRDVGALKAEAARARLAALNPEIEVRAIADRLGAADIRERVRGVAVVVDGSDRLATRYLINDACVLERKPLVSAAIHRFEGQAMVYVPGAGPCFRCLFPHATDDAAPNCAEAGVLGVLPAVLGAIQATECIKLILNLGQSLAGRFLIYDALAMRFQEFAATRRPDCEVCGEHPSILQPADADERFLPVPGLVALSAAALARQLGQPAGFGSSTMLIDVREPSEFDGGHLPTAVNVPLGRLRERLAGLPKDTWPIFVCRSGARSRRACEIAAAEGFARIGHLEGGLLAWAATMNHSIKVES